MYPWRCQLCQAECAEQSGVCAACQAFLPWSKAGCRICGLPLTVKSGQPTICGQCLQRRPYFDHLYAPFWYDPPISEFIVNFKYAHRWEYVPLLMELFQQKLPKVNQDALLLAVPSHPKRIRSRGFNPVREFLRPLTKLADVEYQAYVIRRTRATDTQTGKTKTQRRTNVNNAFAVSQDIVAGRSIILFDDVVTTGATVNEVSKILKKSGAVNIDVWAIARTRRNITK